MIHDCQGSETQKYEKSNQVELGETLPTGAEGIDRKEHRARTEGTGNLERQDKGL